MRVHPRSVAWLGLALALLGCVLALMPARVSDARAASGGGVYIALGDSYTRGR